MFQGDRNATLLCPTLGNAPHKKEKAISKWENDDKPLALKGGPILRPKQATHGAMGPKFDSPKSHHQPK